MIKKMTMQQKMQESLESGDRRGRMESLAEDVRQFIVDDVQPHKKGAATEKMMRICYRFGEIIFDSRMALVEEEVNKHFHKRKPFYNRVIFLFGMFWGVWLSLVVVQLIRSI